MKKNDLKAKNITKPCERLDVTFAVLSSRC